MLESEGTLDRANVHLFHFGHTTQVMTESIRSLRQDGHFISTYTLTKSLDLNQVRLPQDQFGKNVYVYLVSINAGSNWPVWLVNLIHGHADNAHLILADIKGSIPKPLAILLANHKIIRGRPSKLKRTAELVRTAGLVRGAVAHTLASGLASGQTQQPGATPKGNANNAAHHLYQEVLSRKADYAILQTFDLSHSNTSIASSSSVSDALPPPLWLAWAIRKIEAGQQPVSTSPNRTTTEPSNPDEL